MKYLLGPELFWLLLYCLAIVLGRANNPHSKSVEDFIQTSWFWIPASSLLVFGLWWMPNAEKGALLFLRIWIVGFVGCYLVAEKAISASAYQNSGAGMGVLASVCFEFVFLLIGTVAVALKIVFGSK